MNTNRPGPINGSTFVDGAATAAPLGIDPTDLAREGGRGHCGRRIEFRL